MKVRSEGPSTKRSLIPHFLETVSPRGMSDNSPPIHRWEQQRPRNALSRKDVR
jgi:hypothetical protein